MRVRTVPEGHSMRRVVTFAALPKPNCASNSWITDCAEINRIWRTVLETAGWHRHRAWATGATWRSGDVTVHVEQRTPTGYYALVEIVDAYIDPTWNRASKQQVEELLGTRRVDGHPSSSADCWVYSSSRRVPQGSYLCIYFDEQGIATRLEWISE